MASSSDASIAVATSEPQQPPRKRHRVACRVCHLRKVRCDVSLLGMPCTNCRLDKHVCIARDPPDRRPKKVFSVGSDRARTGTAVTLAPATDIVAANDHIPQAASPIAMSLGDDLPSRASPSPREVILGDSTGCALRLNTHDDSGTTSFFPFSSNLPPPADSFSPFPGLASLNNCVIFSYYDFFKPNELSNLPLEDVRYLEIKGSLHVFSAPIVEQILRQYFIYIHPCMPILNEGHIWDMVRRKRRLDARPMKVSLLVFQAVIFAASAFVSLSVIRACGFQSHHEAREILHKRTKLLFDLGVEVDPTSIAQAALLLSYQVTPQQSHGNTSMLVTAIQHARMAKAHLHAVLPGLDNDQRREKKLLWWSCLVRDRVIALGVRRHIQITPDLFPSLDDVPTEDDLAFHYSGSQVYDAQTKRMLATVFVSQCQLAAVLTSTLMLVYPASEMPHEVPSSETERTKTYDRIEDCKMSLRLWFETNTAHLRGDESSTAGHTAHNNTVVNLHRNLTYIYYYSARIALSHHALSMLHRSSLAVAPSSKEMNLVITELESAMMSVTQRITNLVNLGISKCIPISMGAFYALPLILLIVDVQLPSVQRTQEGRQSHLRVCMEAFEHYCQIFNFGGAVSDAITRTLRLEGFAPWPIRQRNKPSLDPPENINVGSNPSSTFTSWMDFLRREPIMYLRMSLSLDYALSKGRFPHEADLPKLITHSPPPPAIMHGGCDLTDFVHQPAVYGVSDMERDMFLENSGIYQLGFVESESPDFATMPVELQPRIGASAETAFSLHMAYGMTSDPTEINHWGPRMSERI